MSSPVLRPSLLMGGVLLCLSALTSSYAHDGDRDHDDTRATARHPRGGAPRADAGRTRDRCGDPPHRVRTDASRRRTDDLTVSTISSHGARRCQLATDPTLQSNCVDEPSSMSMITGLATDPVPFG